MWGIWTTDDEDSLAEYKDLEARTRPDLYEKDYPSDYNCYHQQNPDWDGYDQEDKWLF